MVEKVVEEMMSIRAPTADVGYVANAKYFAHIPHQTPFDPIYQMCHISYFLQHATVKSQICNGTKRVWQTDLFFFYSSFSLISPSVSPLSPQPSLLFHAHANAYANDHFHTEADLSLAMVFFFFGLWFDGFSSDGGGWVRMG